MLDRSVSVVIPTLNEEANIASTIEQTRSSGSCEIVVVDGGSTDRTLEMASQADLVISSAPGRAIQQNVGAERACGEHLLFLHADCQVTTGFTLAISSALSQKGVVAGCFSQTIEHSARKYRIVERGNSLRVQTLGWVYGDQGLFLRRNFFQELGGFPELPLMEDLYFSKILKKRGRLTVSKHLLKVSPRRWEKNGLIRQTLRNWSFVAMSHAGVSAQTLAAWYGHVREENLTESPGP